MKLLQFKTVKVNAEIRTSGNKKVNKVKILVNQSEMAVYHLNVKIL
jgi:hypothetical protein